MWENCEKCEGSGYVMEICRACNGSGEGRYDGSTCKICKGNGEVPEECECEKLTEEEFEVLKRETEDDEDERS